MVIFSGWDSHADRAQGTVISAGSIEIGNNIRCFGMSGSLDVQSRPRDAEIARWVLGWN